MPLYQYECNQCGDTFEQMLPLEKYNKEVNCPLCGGQSNKVMTLGGIQDDHPVWLDDSIIRQLQDTDDPNIRRIESRSDYNKHLKDTGTIPTG